MTRQRWSVLAVAGALLLMLAVLPTSTVYADNPAPVQLFYVTLPETDGLAALDGINTNAASPMWTYFSIAVGVDGTYVYYDQWEDGYAADIANPSVAEKYSGTNLDGVQIWGNGLAADGCAPNINGVTFTCSDAADVLLAGNVIIPYNSVAVPRTAVAQNNVFDDFRTASYSSNYGNTNWAGNWVETGDDASATGGTIYVNTDSGHLRFRENTVANDSIYRSVNLSVGGGCATLTFDLGQSGIDLNEDRLAVQVSSDGGATYATLETFDDPNDAGAKSYDISAYASATTRVRFLARDTLETGFGDGEYWTIDNVRIDWNCSIPVLFDGRDKVGASSSVSMARVIWASESGTLASLGHEMYATAEWGTSYESPVGTNTANAGAMFEYSALSIMASQNTTYVNVDVNGDGDLADAGDIVDYLLQEGGSLLVPAIRQGASVTSDKPVQVLLVTGDVGSTYAARDMTLLPSSAWGSSYWSSVGVNTDNWYNITAGPTRLYLYRPSDSGATHITCERLSPAPTTITQAVGIRGTVTVDLYDNSGANCYASNVSGVKTGEKIFAIGTVDTPNTAGDWSFTLYPESFLSTDGLIGLGLGKDPTDETSTENGGPLWVTTVCASTYVYVDWNNDGIADPVDTDGNGTAEAGTQNGIPVNRLQSVRLFEPGPDAEPYDQSGARVWSRTASGMGDYDNPAAVPGCLLALAWGQDPRRASAGSPGLDVGTSIPPLRLVEGTKSISYANDTAPVGVLNPGDIVYYNITIKNAGASQVSGVRVYDTVPPNMAYVPSTTQWNATGVAPWTAIPDDGVGDGFPVDVSGGVLLGNLAAGQTYYVRFQVTVQLGDYEDITNCDTVFTGDANRFTRCVTSPVATRDWGDLPDTFSTSAAANGPRHSGSALQLGPGWDVETGGVPSDNADGDDKNYVADDEDGVENAASPDAWWTGKGALKFEVSGGPGCLNAWLDFTNNTGTALSSDLDFVNAATPDGYDRYTVGSTFSEHIVNNVLVNDGFTTIDLTGKVPAGDYGSKKLGLRVRLSPPDGNGACTVPIAPTGAIAGGEVEDYMLNPGAPTVIELKWFDVTAVQRGAVTLGWETVSEVDNVGFNLYRATRRPTGFKVQLNRELIPTAVYPGSPSGAVYSFTDRSAAWGSVFYYWLGDVDANGIETLHGPVRVVVWSLLPRLTR